MAGSTPSPQRSWRAACPNCGAPVEFRSAASVSAVCSFCRSTLAREGDTLRRTGEAAELFEDHSPLQLGASGRLQGVTFTLIGRLQLAYADGTWNEWHALFDNGRSAWLSEDNGAYVLSFETPLAGAAPAFAQLQPGARVQVGGAAWDVASVTLAHVLSAQGELPQPPPASSLEFVVADLRNSLGEVATLDYSDPQAAQLSVGRSATLGELAMQGLRETSEKTLGARALNCPSCGASLEVKLASTQSLSCHQCHALIDLSQGVGEQLASIQQAARPLGGREPKIPLGSTGRLAIGAEGPLDWQVVGYLVREDLPEDGESPTPWSEYLLFNRTAGFAFLVDSSEGWSVVRPLTGAPQLSGDRALWQDEPYRQGYSYAARVSWVEGEFYWRVKRDERAQVTDFAGEGAALGKLLSREQTGSELTWSGGRQLSVGAVAEAFKLTAEQQFQLPPDVKPLSSGSSGLSLKTALILFFVLVVVVLLLSRCGGRDCDDVAQAYGANSAEYRQCLNARSSGGRSGGGAFGGYSSGGGHK
jgi:ribosomal protein L37AE/L43A